MALIYDEQGFVIGDDGLGDDTSGASGSWGEPEPVIESWGGENFTPELRGDVVADSDVGYYQNKINEFQRILNAVDSTNAQLLSLRSMVTSEEQRAALDVQISEYDSRKTAFKLAAEAFNAVAGMVNAVGGSLGNINIPSGLGFAPLAVPLAVAAAIAGAAVLVSWGVTWIDNSHSLAQNLAMEITDPELRDAALANAAAVAIAGQSASGGTLGQMSNILKYAAIAGVVFIAYKMFVDKK